MPNRFSPAPHLPRPPARRIARSLALWAFCLCPALAATPAALHAKTPRCEPFGDGEKTVFTLNYLGFSAGTAEFTSQKTKDAWQLATLAKTDPVFSLFYHVEDRYETTTDAENFRPLRMTATINESRQTGTKSHEYDHKKLSVHILDHRDDKKMGQIRKNEHRAISAQTLDAISALFSVRREPLKRGKEIAVDVLIGDEVKKILFLVEGEETLSTKLGKIPSWVLKVSVFKDGAYKELPESLIWVEKSDARRILKIKAKIKVGSIVAYLKSFEGGTHFPECRS